MDREEVNMGLEEALTTLFGDEAAAEIAALKAQDPHFVWREVQLQGESSIGPEFTVEGA